MRKLLTIALWWVAAPALSIAAGAPGSFESLAQTARVTASDSPAVLQRLSNGSKLSESSYSLAVSSRDTHAGGLNFQALKSTVSPRAATLVSFSEGTAVDAATAESTAVTPEVNASVSPPIPEPQSYALMIAGLVALGFMATRRGRH